MVHYARKSLKMEHISISSYCLFLDFAMAHAVGHRPVIAGGLIQF
jgi:hypothetical protein